MMNFASMGGGKLDSKLDFNADSSLESNTDSIDSAQYLDSTSSQKRNSNADSSLESNTDSTPSQTRDSTNHLDSTPNPRKTRKNSFWNYAFYAFILSYCLCIVIYSRYAFNLDDALWWLDIYHNIPITNGINLGIGRFYPLAFSDLNMLMQISHSPYLFFGYHAIITLFIALLFWNFLKNALPNSPFIRFIICFICFLNMGFVTIMVGICYPESPLCFALVLFVFMSYKIYKSENRAIFFILGILAANMAIYLKEPSFLAIGAFGFLNIIYMYASKKINRIYFIYCILLLVSALIFVVIYTLYVMPNVESSYEEVAFNKANLSFYNYAIFLIKGLFNFILNDAFIVILLPFITLCRIYSTIKSKSLDSIAIFWDSLLVGGILYFAVYIKLQLFTSYYLVPIYFIVAGSVVYYLGKYLRYKIAKLIFGFCMILYITNVLPQSIWTFMSLKSQGVAFHQSLDFMAKYISQNSDKTRIYFDGIGRGSGYNDHFWFYFIKYLEEIYNVSNFDVLSKEPNATSLLQSPLHWQNDKNSPFTIHNSTSVSTPKKGDIIILNQNSNKYIDSAYLQNMQEKYELIYKTNVVGLPYISLKMIIKYLMINLGNSPLAKDALSGNSNPFKLPINNYIYKVK
ncbi:hypothetical protein CCY99_04400 [Helicobacter sp. 16-1353]|uniref:hypothetical protein n=1 Tax=Helicobacter sp. 16-1353 TaxID=2004996 RepID=UPI000DCD623A|nr:hypothetical protein [Helicobacter sp. 16-1353]RAX54258.1 hypothetical protein CCY99_04400 [Helicobacter sp. 16-1353]